MERKRTMVLLHGWPDSPRAWSCVAPQLALAGWHVLVPALRGVSPTRFLREDTPRTGQLTYLGRDLLDFIDALNLQQPALVGYDWGARAAAKRCQPPGDDLRGLRHQQSGAGAEPEPGAKVLVPLVHGYAAGGVSRAGRLARFCPHHVRNIGPAGWYSDQEFNLTAEAFENPGWPEVTLYSCLNRWGHAPRDPAYEHDEARLQPALQLAVPTLVLHGVGHSPREGPTPWRPLC